MKTKSLFTRGVKIVYIVVLLLYAVSASSQNERGRIRTDSLRNVLQKAKMPEEKLTVLKELTTINRQQKVDVSLGKELVDMMRVKIQTLRRDGELKEAIQVYKNMLETNAAINDKAFDRQMTQIALFEHLVGGLAVEQAAAHAGADHRHGHLVALGDLGKAVGDEAVNVLLSHARAGAGEGAVNDLFDVGAEGDDAVKLELHLDEAHLFVRGVGVDDLGVRQLPVHEIHIDGGEIGELHADALRLHAELLELVDGDHHRVLGELVVADDALRIHPALGAHDGLFNVHNDDDGVVLLGDDVDDLAAADRDLRGDVSAGDVGDVLRRHGDHGVQMVLFQHLALKIGDLFHGGSSVFCF